MMKSTLAGSFRPPARGLLAAAALVALTACGAPTGAPTATGGPGTAVGSSPAAGGDATTAQPVEGAGTATVTMADGAVYQFAMTTCDTSETVPDQIPLTNGYDLAGATSDGEYVLTLARLGFTADAADVTVGTIAGDFDENGQNEEMLYNAVVAALDLSVDGPRVSGTAEFKAIGPTRPHGDQTTATIDVNC